MSAEGYGLKGLCSIHFTDRMKGKGNKLAHRQKGELGPVQKWQPIDLLTSSWTRRTRYGVQEILA